MGLVEGHGGLVLSNLFSGGGGGRSGCDGVGVQVADGRRVVRRPDSDGRLRLPEGEVRRLPR